jgi:hypothetical protein
VAIVEMGPIPLQLEEELALIMEVLPNGFMLTLGRLLLPTMLLMGVGIMRLTATASQVRT